MKFKLFMNIFTIDIRALKNRASTYILHASNGYT